MGDIGEILERILGYKYWPVAFQHGMKGVLTNGKGLPPPSAVSSKNQKIDRIKNVFIVFRSTTNHNKCCMRG